jgi:hypothetical protein
MNNNQSSMPTFWLKSNDMIIRIIRKVIQLKGKDDVASACRCDKRVVSHMRDP